MRRINIQAGTPVLVEPENNVKVIIWPLIPPFFKRGISINIQAGKGFQSPKTSSRLCRCT